MNLGSVADIEHLLLCNFITMLRPMALIMSMPIFGSPLIPGRIKIALSVMMGIWLFNGLPSITLPSSLAEWAILVPIQIGVGIMIGLIWQFVFQAFSVAGQIMSMNIGFGFAVMNDPQSNVAVPVLSQFYLMVATLLFLACDEHIALFEVLRTSYNIVPLTSIELNLDTGHFLEWSSWILKGGLGIALPATAALLISNIAFGIIAKVSPQINILSIGFALFMFLGMIIIWFMLLSAGHEFSMLSEIIYDFYQTTGLTNV